MPHSCPRRTNTYRLGRFQSKYIIEGSKSLTSAPTYVCYSHAACIRWPGTHIAFQRHEAHRHQLDGFPQARRSLIGVLTLKKREMKRGCLCFNHWRSGIKKLRIVCVRIMWTKPAFNILIDLPPVEITCPENPPFLVSPLTFKLCPTIFFWHSICYAKNLTNSSPHARHIKSVHASINIAQRFSQDFVFRWIYLYRGVPFVLFAYVSLRYS